MEPKKNLLFTKEILNISAQIESLSKNKNINFENENQKEEMRVFLQRNNYLNVISLKYLFSSGQIKINNKFMHRYDFKVEYPILKDKYWCYNKIVGSIKNI